MCTSNEDVDEEEKKVLLVVVADAVIDPGAVVVHARDTTLAGRAMVTLRYFDGVAFYASALKDRLQLSDFLGL